MEFELILKIKVDRDANFLETFGDNCEVIADLVVSSLYDIDDLTLQECEVRRDK